MATLYEDTLRLVEEKMEKCINVLEEEFRGIRSGRATPGLVDNIRAEFYGAMTPIKQMANISVPEPRLLVIRPYEASSLKNIEKAILKSGLGITPNNDGKLIRLNIPSLSEDRRKQLAAQVKEISEKSKVSIRNIRREGNKDAAQMEKDSKISEDDSTSLKEDIQELTKKYEEKIENLLAAKVKEIMEI